MSQSSISLIVGFLAIIGGLHFVLSYEMMKDISKLLSLKKEKLTKSLSENQYLLNNLKSIHCFFAVSNGMVMLIFSLFVFQIWSLAAIDIFPHNPGYAFGFFFLVFTPFIVLVNYDFYNMTLDLEEFDIKCFFIKLKRILRDKEKSKEEKKVKLYVKTLYNCCGYNSGNKLMNDQLFFSVVVRVYCLFTQVYFLISVFRISSNHNQSSRFTTIDKYFLIEILLAFVLWLLSFMLRPLKKINDCQLELDQFGDS